MVRRECATTWSEENVPQHGQKRMCHNMVRRECATTEVELPQNSLTVPGSRT